MKRFSILVSMFLLFSFFIISCGGGSSGVSTGGSSSANELGRVEGNITSLNVKLPTQQKTFISHIKSLVNFIQPAIAQDSEFCGIVVMVVRGGEVIATTETNCDGTFVLDDVAPGEALLMFEIGGENNSVPISIPSGGTVQITVSIEDEGVEVDKLNVISGSINCVDETINIGGNGVDEIIIEGEGQNCINAEGICEVNLFAHDIELKGCNFCVRTTDESSVLIVADGGDFKCNSVDDGINTNGDSSVDLEAGKRIDISSEGEDGIDASGGSQVNLDSESCDIRARQNPILEDTEKNVNTDGCGEITLEDTEENDEMEEDEGDEEPGEGVCEFDCIGDECELFCNDEIPADCVDSCSNVANFSLCIQDCAGIECGDADCDELCAEEDRECEFKEVCEEVCDGEPICDEVCVERECAEFACEEICVERECIEFACDEICVERECLEFRCEEICDGEGENRVCEEVCGDDCIEFGECIRFEEECGDDCIEFGECIRFEEECGDDCVEFGECIRFEEECECKSEVIECEQVEVCEEICVEEALGCRFECEEVI